MIAYQKLMVGLFASLCFGFSSAADWGVCAGDLDRVSRMGRDVRDIADHLASMTSELSDSERDVSDECERSGSSECREAKRRFSELNREFHRHLGELSDLTVEADRRVRRVTSGCASNTRSESPCDVFRSYLGELSRAQIIQVCKQQLPESDCRKCLGKL